MYVFTSAKTTCSVLTLTSFLQAAQSRAELSCSRDSFLYLCSFHQVDPSFVDFVRSFGLTDEPLDYHMTGFSCHDTLDVANKQLLDIPKLGRSGREIRVHYLLRSLERSIGSDNKMAYNIRQMAAYHTFDLITGKALWINIKANRLVENRIKEAATEFPALGPKAMGSLAGTFAATLVAHMVHLEWCDEDWRECTNGIEKKIRNILTKAQTARIDRQPTGVKGAFTKASTLYTSKSSAGELPEKEMQAPLSWKNRIWDSVKWLDPYNHSSDAPDALSAHSLPRFLRDINADDRDQIDRLTALGTLSFEQLQQLHYFGELLENFRLVTDLNGQTLRDIAESYQDLWDREEFLAEIKKGCRKELAAFLRRIHRIRRNLEIRISQVKSLMAWVEEGKTLVTHSTVRK